ncbi:hypothetical protein [Nocardia caishijiensis]|uniref:hypothetical protein n=1 Tax=Nocardia caishijiensis TaxID=184756 RepID=UPI00082F3811|nr:hypothetical protein [Nocardia caishijiensis]
MSAPPPTHPALVASAFPAPLPVRLVPAPLSPPAPASTAPAVAPPLLLWLVSARPAPPRPESVLPAVSPLLEAAAAEAAESLVAESFRASADFATT